LKTEIDIQFEIEANAQLGMVLFKNEPAASYAILEAILWAYTLQT
jgi:steroid 5-alpha reductase family enzyme